MAHKQHIVGGILISDFPNCDCGVRKTKNTDFREWKTEKDIRLGSEENEVLDKYGKPSKKSIIEGTIFSWVIKGTDQFQKANNRTGDEVFVYSGAEDDLRIAIFGIRQRKVVWIFLSYNE